MELKKAESSFLNNDHIIIIYFLQIYTIIRKFDSAFDEKNVYSQNLTDNNYILCYFIQQININ